MVWKGVPLSIKFLAKLGANTFEADGDFLFDEGFNMTFRSWINAQSTTDGSAEQLEVLTSQLKSANDAAADAVAANTPT